VQGVVLVTATAFVVINLIVDVIYGYLNPKVRLG
jgi:ABC-type dipeptide/oligopeptide/nickel transport system permease component